MQRIDWDRKRQKENNKARRRNLDWTTTTATPTKKWHGRPNVISFIVYLLLHMCHYGFIHSQREKKQCPMILSSRADKNGRKNHLHFTHFCESETIRKKKNKTDTHKPLSMIWASRRFGQMMTLISILNWQITYHSHSHSNSIPRKTHSICSSLICVDLICIRVCIRYTRHIWLIIEFSTAFINFTASHLNGFVYSVHGGAEHCPGRTNMWGLFFFDPFSVNILHRKSHKIGQVSVVCVHCYNKKASTFSVFVLRADDLWRLHNTSMSGRYS